MSTVWFERTRFPNRLRQELIIIPSIQQNQTVPGWQEFSFRIEFHFKTQGLNGLTNINAKCIHGGSCFVGVQAGIRECAFLTLDA